MAATFAGGGLIPCLTWFLLVPALGAWDVYRNGSLLRPVALLVCASVAGGVLAGSAVGPGPRWPAAFGAAFGATLWIPLLVLAGLPALSGGERLAELLVGLAPALAVSHAALGALGLALGGGGLRRAGVGALVFGAAGLAGGVLLAAVAPLAAGGTGTAAFAGATLGGGAACLLPLALAGWWLGRPTVPNARRVRARSRYGR